MSNSGGHSPHFRRCVPGLTGLESTSRRKHMVFGLRVGIMLRSDGTCHAPEFQFCPTDGGHISVTIALETILEPAVLRRVWKDVRKRERGIHLTQIPLVRDSTGGIAFELSLREVLDNLRLRLLEGTYRPHAPIVIEAAKSKLLHRRLSFLAFEDGLILGSLVQAARAALMKRMPAWVSFGQLAGCGKTSGGTDAVSQASNNPTIFVIYNMARCYSFRECNGLALIVEPSWTLSRPQSYSAAC